MEEITSEQKIEAALECHRRSVYYQKVSETWKERLDEVMAELTDEEQKAYHLMAEHWFQRLQQKRKERGS